MALTATMHRLHVGLSDVERNVYEELDLRLARHPSESMRYLVLRTLAYALSYEEGIAFSRGLSVDDEPAVWIKDPTGTITAWIEVGAPSADRLHRASKAAGRVAIFTSDVRAVKREASSRAIHKADAIDVYAVETSLLDALSDAMERNTRWELTRTGEQLYVGVAGKSHEGTIVRHALHDEA